MFLTIQKMWFATRLAILCKGTVFTLLLAALLSTGCTVVEIKEQTEMLEGASVIHGKIQRATDQQGPLAVMGFELIDGVLSYQALQYTTESGEFHFNATPGIYQIIAFVDVNRDGAYQSNEYAAYHKESPLITVSEGQTIEVEPLVITAEPIEMDQPVDTEIQGSKLYANTGRIISLDDPIFLRENYGVGLWRPMDFINTVGGGLFMLQEYDPDKVPVLFVHGINGGPVDWKVVIDQVDRSKFQPWIYYYPSGLQLDIVSDNLVNAVSKLRERYGYKKLKVVAHSMGGLVVRSFVKKYTELYPSDYTVLDLVMTVNSPMGGMASAASGVKHSPIVVQSWRDVAKDSEFVTGLLDWQWPKDIPYHLVFSFVIGKGSDGTVPLESQIPRSLQKDSTRMYGFTDDHVGILSNPDFISLFDEILEGVSRTSSEATAYRVTKRPAQTPSH